MDKMKEEAGQRKKDACKRVDELLSTSFILEAADAEAKEFIRIVVPERDRAACFAIFVCFHFVHCGKKELKELKGLT